MEQYDGETIRGRKILLIERRSESPFVGPAHGVTDAYIVE
jgi:hypothetical protein